MPGQARVSQNRIKVTLSSICLQIKNLLPIMVDIKVAPSTMVDKKFAPNNGRLVDHLKYNFPSSRSLLLRESRTEMVEQMHPRKYSSRATR